MPILSLWFKALKNTNAHFKKPEAHTEKNIFYSSGDVCFVCFAPLHSALSIYDVFCRG